MSQIDPLKLLTCLSILLSPNGGIKSREEVQRIASLMTRYSKKLVSKCIYIQILKCSETELLSLFMGSGGWRLVHVWLTESIVAKNWPLVEELLGLLLLCPVEIDRLKTNNCPKLVKELSKDETNFAIRALASKLVEQWLKTVKGEHITPILLGDIPQIIANASLVPMVDMKQEMDIDLKIENHRELKQSNDEISQIKDQTDANIADIKLPDDGMKSESFKPEIVNGTTEISEKYKDKIISETEKDQETLPVLKITLKDGKQIIKVEDYEHKTEKSNSSDKEKSNRHKSKSKEKSSSSKSSTMHTSKLSNSSERHRSSSPSKHSSKEKSRDKSKHSSESSKSKSYDHSRRSSNSSSSSKSKSSKHRDDSSKSSSSKDKYKERDNDEKYSKLQNDKNREADLQTAITKLGKIPKLSNAKKDKPSISIEVRKPEDPKPKTVKTFNSKFRKHGLEEEIKPPPSRASILTKKAPPVAPILTIPKRPSPVNNDAPPEKKPKTIEAIDKPGAIKLIPAKPKPMVLLESDMFMDALNASATNKKEPKKRKRRISGSKDGNTPSDNSPPNTPTTTSASSPNRDNKSVPLRFYQDTLDTEEDKEKSSEKSSGNNSDKSESKSPTNSNSPGKDDDTMDVPELPVTLTVNGLKGVLCYHKKKGPKKSIKWKPDLEEIQYFELDETERVNVTKGFTQMRYLERINEREVFQKARNINDDVMEEKTNWKILIPIDSDGQITVEYGKNSKEKDIQASRQIGSLQPLYFHKSMIPDSPLEADMETHASTEPIVIPLEDITGNQDNISDFRNMPWPEPKGNAPPASTTNVNIPPMFQPPITQFPNTFPNPQFGVPPGFQAPNMVPSEWQNGMPPHMMGPNTMPPMCPPPGTLMPGAIPPGNMGPGLMMPPENMMMNPEMFNAPNPMYPHMPPETFGMMENMNMPPQNMFPPDFNIPQGMPGPDGPPGPNFRGGMRGRGSAGHWRGKGNWEGPQRGRGGHSRGTAKAVCMYFNRKGSCRMGANCSFLHPGVNCPY